ncbi:DUF1127 domain-containing protein [Shinella daejeonensis]|uniref:DUF1127 domain-containing protein n=1 Tax=Shinella daejeonensis TaxID=659017 RepID=UPI0020C81F5A|nr:DUF1127 domain-containing protein [Shinella daejeonensis]MCP8893720.1 DUF1127 domain-containing protein [Shinella daejeonensis]
MSPHKASSGDTDLAVRVEGKGFYYAIRHFLGEITEERRQRRLARRTLAELSTMPDHMKDDIGWTDFQRKARCGPPATGAHR